MINRVLRLIREFHRLTQTALADELRISKSYLSEIESGKKNPSLDLLNAYADVFHLAPSDLLLFAERLDGEPSDRRLKKVEQILQFLEWVVEDERGAA